VVFAKKSRIRQSLFQQIQDQPVAHIVRFDRRPTPSTVTPCCIDALIRTQPEDCFVELPAVVIVFARAVVIVFARAVVIVFARAVVIVFTRTPSCHRIAFPHNPALFRDILESEFSFHTFQQFHRSI
jgi:hypothetical protein